MKSIHSRNLSLIKDQIQKLDKIVQGRLSERDVYQKLLDNKTASLATLKLKEGQYKQVSLLFNEVFNMLRESMKHSIENVITTALQDILQDRSLKFMMKSCERHNKIVTDFVIQTQSGGELVEFDPMNEMGGGIADILCLALRVVCLTLHKSSLSQILIMDEALTSLSNYSHDTIERTAKWLRSICETNGIQLIMVTQKESITEVTHKSFKVKNHNGIGHVETC